MRTATKAVFGGCLALLALAVVVSHPARAAQDSPAEALALLHEVAQAYKDAPAFTDDVQMEVAGLGGTQSGTISIAMGRNLDAQVRMFGYIMTAVDGRFFLQREGLPGKYFAKPLKNNFVETYETIAGGSAGPLPQCALRYGKRPEDYVAAFNMLVARDVKLVGRQLVDYEDKSVHQLRFTADGGATINALVDPSSKFIVKIRIALGPAMLTFSMNPKRHDRLPQPIAFDTTNRKLVANPAELRLGEGDAAPDFTLETLDREFVTLGSHRGSVVVLDFWATWCGPCRWSLPKLQEFASWVEQEGLAIKVFAVDVLERQPTNEQKRQKVAQYWKRQGFTMPTLMDFDGSVARTFDVGPIPHTVVVGPDGKILKTHVGFDPKMVDTLKRETLEALNSDR